SREARMYPLALAFTLGQACVFLRSLRRGGIANYAATAGLTALAISATFSTALALIPEGLYLALMLMRSPARNAARVVRCAASIIGGILLLAPFLIIYYLRTQSGPADAALLTWIARPSIGAPIALFNKATGTYGFPLLAILVVTGVARGWSQRRESICYLLLWSFAPPIVLMIVSFAIHPAFVERYLLSCFVPFFALAAIGVLELRPAALRPGAVALLVAVALAHDATWSSRTHGDEWAEAAAVASTNLTATEAIGVAPRYAGNVVRYYLRDARSAPAVEPLEGEPLPTVVIVTESYANAHAADLARRYPRLLAHPRGLVIRAH
ncbi:MAG: hypothetical protein ACREQC_07955, partial [Candidatus Binataceae bacterium]